MNLGIKARGVLSHSGNTVETIVPLNHCSFNAGGIRNCAAGRQQNDLGTLDPPPSPKDCCSKVWIVGTHVSVHHWRVKNGQRKLLEASPADLPERYLAPHQPQQARCLGILANHSWGKKPKTCVCFLWTDTKAKRTRIAKIITSNSWHNSCPRSVYSILTPCVVLWNIPIHNKDVNTYYSIQ